MKEQRIIASIIIIFLGTTAYCQNFFEPNYALKTPRTLEILNIDISDEMVKVSASIENQVDGGYFCIDPETYIVTDKGERLKLVSVIGLPLCPEQYRFTKIGEVKFLTLSFPPLSEEAAWIDIIEECGSNCLGIYGLCLDHSLNAEINICFRDIERGRLDDAIKRFENLRTKRVSSSNPITGSIYLNLISLYKQTDQEQIAEELKRQFKTLVIPHKEKFLKNID